MRGSYLHFTSLKAKKKTKTLLILGNFAQGALLPQIRKCAFLLKGFFLYSFILVDFSLFPKWVDSLVWWILPNNERNLRDIIGYP